MQRVTVYQVGYSTFYFTPSHITQPVVLELPPHTRLAAEPSTGRVLVYRPGTRAGRSVRKAVELGWCRISGEEEPLPAAPGSWLDRLRSALRASIGPARRPPSER